ncbi:ribosome maturation factor RimM [Paraburkholderia acidisoli]|jgi:16S rRNA processing protein RimM|uniref:Ribosome maturation factor RimM n=1 Tax=Paraburkholderia acidisoli TaxID=2571748 RepID=A0A7Z2GIB4_9BURK|nr:ribosome maturation factor RimM [Paraburkholderia acidisoli]QGZ61975.1 ribosome maturation factor RimM [Paraburkholderia acidisoli]
MSAHDDAKSAVTANTASSDEATGGANRRNAPSFGAFVRKPARDSAAKAAPAAEPLRAESTASWPADAVEVGAVVDAYGLKGWVKVAPHAQDGRALLSATRWWLIKGREGQSHREFHSAGRVSAKVHGDSVVAQLAGVDDREAALRLRGARVYVTRAEFPAPEADEYYWVDLIGLDVANEAGVELGKVADLIDNGAQSVLRITYPSTDKEGKPVTGERLIPFVGVFVKTVDLAAKRIVVDWDADY